MTYNCSGGLGVIMSILVVEYLGFNPKIATERLDSGEVRIQKICNFIQESKFCIHDLSRLQASSGGEYFRLNMSFELGIDYGCRYFSSNHMKDKILLILEKEKYAYMKALSDLSGSDIKCHQNKPPNIVREVRNWFVESAGLSKVASATKIWYEFNDFMSDFYDKRKSESFTDEDLQMMPIVEYIAFVRTWCSQRSGVI